MDLRLRSVFREVFDNDKMEIWDGMTSRELPEWDSLAHVKLIIGLEEEFGVQFTTQEVVEARSVGDLKRLLTLKGITG